MKGLLPNSLTLAQEDAKLFESLFEEDESDRMILISVIKFVELIELKLANTYFNLGKAERNGKINKKCKKIGRHKWRPQSEKV